MYVRARLDSFFIEFFTPIKGLLASYTRSLGIRIIDLGDPRLQTGSSQRPIPYELGSQ